MVLSMSAIAKSITAVAQASAARVALLESTPNCKGPTDTPYSIGNLARLFEPTWEDDQSRLSKPYKKKGEERSDLEGTRNSAQSAQFEKAAWRIGSLGSVRLP